MRRGIGACDKFRSHPWRDWRISASRPMVLVSLSALLLLAGMLTQFGRDAISPVAVPTHLDQLEPAVAELVRRHVKRAQDQPNARTVGELGLVYEANELWYEARRAYTWAKELNPKQVLWSYRCVLMDQALGDYEAVARETRKLVTAYPDFAPGWHLYGQLLLDQGEFDAAGKAFERVVRLRPESAEGYVGRADVCLHEEDPQGAVTHLQAALQKDAEYKVAHYLLGMAFARLGRPELSLRHLSAGVGGKTRQLGDSTAAQRQRYAVNSKARIQQGMTQMLQGMPHEAARTFEEVLRSDPTNVTALNNLAGAYMRLKRSEDAKRLLIRALERDDRKHTTFVNLANWEAVHGKLAQALRYADRAVRLSPRAPLAHRTRAAVLFRAGRMADALDSAEEAAKLDPLDPRLQDQCADIAWRLQRVTTCIEHYKRAIELQPTRIVSWLGMARALGSIGDVAAAEKAVARARHLAPADPRVDKLSEAIQNLRQVQ